MPKNIISNQTKKEAVYRSLINPKLMDELKERILEVVLLKKRYKEKGFNAKRLADELSTNTRYISAVINVRFHSNYSAFINKFRIEEAMTLLTDKRYNSLNMEEISSIVGFSNRQSFYTAFFKLNGMTPREYRLQHLNGTTSEAQETPAPSAEQKQS